MGKSFGKTGGQVIHDFLHPSFDRIEFTQLQYSQSFFFHGLVCSLAIFLLYQFLVPADYVGIVSAYIAPDTVIGQPQSFGYGF